ncbi:MAG: hypothetical protein Fur0021_40340 [Candidatus Promineifilaceae bacterium]
MCYVTWGYAIETTSRKSEANNTGGSIQGHISGLEKSLRNGLTSYKIGSSSTGLTCRGTGYSYSC